MNRRLQGDVSLNVHTHDERESGEALDWLADPAPTQEARLADEQESAHRHQALRAALQTLKPRERHIFVARHLTDDPPNLEELAVQYGISRERIRQIELRALQKVKAAVQAMADNPTRVTQPNNSKKQAVPAGS
jgi:RNA polymerase sigma-32 factor